MWEVVDLAEREKNRIDARLTRFWLPSVELKNVSAQQALNELRAQFIALGGDLGIGFAYEVDAADTEILPVTLSLGNVSLIHALRIVAGLAGVGIEPRDTGIAMVSLPKSGKDINSANFRVPPDFLSSRGMIEASELFVKLPEDTKIRYEPSQSVLTVTGERRMLLITLGLIDPAGEPIEW